MAKWKDGEVKLMFVDVRKGHLNARREEEEWVVLLEEFSESMGNTRGCGDGFTECGKRPQGGRRTAPEIWRVKGFAEAKERPRCFSKRRRQ